MWRVLSLKNPNIKILNIRIFLTLETKNKRYILNLCKSNYYCYIESIFWKIQNLILLNKKNM